MPSQQRGSSPRMRGTRRNRTYDPFRVRIIPAHAGNTLRMRSRAQPRRDHPRACGEHEECKTILKKCQGSSPRMRGTLATGKKIVVKPGIIPAHAGNTFVLFGCVVVCGDHPRACGEHSMLNAAARASTGSSPRMRGTLNSRFFGRQKHGIIPAHAGNTSYGASLMSRARDHPRACGEHNKHPDRVPPVKGSSPRMRGTRRGTRRQTAQAGIIPAHAGNTGAVAQ